MLSGTVECLIFDGHTANQSRMLFGPDWNLTSH